MARNFPLSRRGLDWPIFPGDNLELHGARDWATYLLGGHIQRKFGVLDLSFSYVNLHRTNSLTSWGDNSIKGVGAAQEHAAGLRGGQVRRWLA